MPRRRKARRERAELSQGHSAQSRLMYLTKRYGSAKHWMFNFRLLADEFGEQTTCQGLPNVVTHDTYTLYSKKNPLWRRVIWFVATVVFLVALIALVLIGSVGKLLAKNTLTSYDSNLEKEMIPPSITICNFNPYPTSKKYLDKLSDLSLSEMYDYSVWKNLSSPDPGISMGENKEKSSCTLGSGLIQVVNGSVTSDCSLVGEWNDYIDATKRLCSTFNFYDNVTVKIEGDFMELHFWEDPLKVQPQVVESGLEIMIHQKGSYPPPHGNRIAPGGSAVIQITNSVFEEYQPYAEPACLIPNVDDFPSYGPIRSDHKGPPTKKYPYSEQNCLAMCELETVSSVCKCVPDWVNVNVFQSEGHGSTKCSKSKELIHCYQKESTVTKYKNCQKKCLPVCEQLDYTTSTSILPSPHPFSAEIISLGWDICQHEFNRALQPFYKKLKSTGARSLDSYTGGSPNCGATSGVWDSSDKDLLSTECAAMPLDELARITEWLSDYDESLSADKVGVESVEEPRNLKYLVDLWVEIKDHYDPLLQKYTMDPSVEKTLGGLYTVACGNKGTKKGSSISPPFSKYREAALFRAAGEKYDINIGYKHFIKTKVTKIEAYDWFEFISEFGGYAGLFLGFTLLTFLELLELVGLVLVACLCPNCATPENNKEEESSNVQANKTSTAKYVADGGDQEIDIMADIEGEYQGGEIVEKDVDVSKDVRSLVELIKKLEARVNELSGKIEGGSET
jgi:hypothetical protein